MASGETVTVRTREASDGHFTASSTSADVATRDRGRVHPLTGPIYVRDANPGDVLQVDILGYELGQWGWTVISPPAGFLGDEFQENRLHIWHFDHDTASAELKPGVRVPINRPFLGVIGLAWNEPGEFRTIPPRAQGGNMDIKYLVAGSTLYLPVDLPGAMLSVGDGHAAQGDGEVCVSAIECDLTAHLRLTVRRDIDLTEPQYETPEYYATTGIDTTLEIAAKKATRAMIGYLMSQRGLSRDESYMLCSVAMDLKICETVDMPNYLVSAHLPKSVFL
jgi:acetamidase/formamidase